MTREEKYRKLDEKSPLKYGSHRESLLRYERYVKKYNSMIKRLPSDKDINKLVDIFLEKSTRGSSIEDSECKIVICKVKDFQLNLVKGYTYELIRDNPKVKIESKIGFYSLSDFLFSVSFVCELTDSLDDLYSEELNWWCDYIREEKNKEYRDKLDSKKSIGEYVCDIRNRFNNKFMGVFGLDPSKMELYFDRKDWLINRVLGGK